jgi:hypothetical protein
MTIVTTVTTHYRYKRPPRKRKAVALDVPAIVVKDKPRPAAELAQPTPAIVTAKNPHRRHGRFGDVPDMTPEENKQRGEAADALWRELVRRVREE